MHGTFAGLPPGIPGMVAIDGAMQQAPQAGRQATTGGGGGSPGDRALRDLGDGLEADAAEHAVAELLQQHRAGLA